jgi:hypothetical protein
MWRIFKSRRRLFLVSVGVVAACGGITAIAVANIKPEKADKIQLESTNLVIATVPEEGQESASIECQYMATNGTIEAATINAPFTAPGFHGNGGAECGTSVGGVTASVTTKGAWKLIDKGAAKGAIEIPKEGAVITLNAPEKCKFTLAPTGPVTVEGTWHNGVNSEREPSDLELNEALVSTSVTSCTGLAVTKTKLTGVILVEDQTAPGSAVTFS